MGLADGSECPELDDGFRQVDGVVQPLEKVIDDSSHLDMSIRRTIASPIREAKTCSFHGSSMPIRSVTNPSVHEGRNLDCWSAPHCQPDRLWACRESSNRISRLKQHLRRYFAKTFAMDGS